MSTVCNDEKLVKILKDYNINYEKVCMINWTLRQAIWDWCEENSISATYLGSIYAFYDVWMILDEQHMVWFKLRWN